MEKLVKIKMALYLGGISCGNKYIDRLLSVYPSVHNQSYNSLKKRFVQSTKNNDVSIGTILE